MPKWVSDTAKKAARRVDLYDFLLALHPDAVQREGNSLRLRGNHSVSLKRGYAGYKDFGTGETGNAVDFLTHYLGYAFLDAVAALCQFAGIPLDGSGRPQNAPGDEKGVQCGMTAYDQKKRLQEPPEVPLRAFFLPEPVHGPSKQVFAYLTQIRGIPPALVQMLLDDGLLYQESCHANLVFVDPARRFAELRGSNRFKPFHQVRFRDPAAFWWFKPLGRSTAARIAYVCEGAIDAVSLYLLLLTDPANHAEHGLYCSIGGVANQPRIDAIVSGMAATGRPTVIAVDHDAAGAACRARNPACPSRIPVRKDWNDDLTDLERKHPGYMDKLGKLVTQIRKAGSV